MTCKDCIHYDVCIQKNGITKYYDRDFYSCTVESNCDNFKDKSKIIELPCKVGDTVSDVVQTVFLTIEQAKQKLKELQNE